MELEHIDKLIDQNIQVMENINSLTWLGAALFIGMSIGFFLGMKTFSAILKKRIKEDPQMFNGF